MIEVGGRCGFVPGQGPESERQDAYGEVGAFVHWLAGVESKGGDRWYEDDEA